MSEPISRDGVERCIQKLEDRFHDNPLDFFTESDVKFALYSLLKENVKPNDSLRVEATTNHREEHLKEITSHNNISLVHSEINLNLGDKTRRLDLGIFRSEAEHIKYSFKGGTKRWNPEDLAVAIEIKFIKVMPNLNEDITDRIENDIKKLNKCNKAAKYLLIFSNKDIFEEKEDEFEKMQDKNPKITFHRIAPEIGKSP